MVKYAKFTILKSLNSNKVAQVDVFGNSCLITIGYLPEKISFFDIAMEDFNDLLKCYNKKPILTQIVPIETITDMKNEGWDLVYFKNHELSSN